jgi:hypothetical protein
VLTINISSALANPWLTGGGQAYIVTEQQVLHIENGIHVFALSRAGDKVAGQAGQQF